MAPQGRERVWIHVRGLLAALVTVVVVVGSLLVLLSLLGLLPLQRRDEIALVILGSVVTVWVWLSFLHRRGVTVGR